ncbi:hypothetical protein [Klebsiella pneumoniae]|uniref:hypothetical protein n=1 Tax=Klebsiella pneumoniae TaxID=573 RepID=UPI003F5D5031
MLIYPAQPLTTLTPEQVADITASVRKGQSWHAFEAYKKHKAQLENAAFEHAKIAGRRDELLAALQKYNDAFMEFDGENRDSRTRMRRAVTKAKSIIARAKGGAA